MKNMVLSGKVLGIVTVVAWGLGFLMSGSIIGDFLSLLGTICFILTIIAFIREWRNRKKLVVPKYNTPPGPQA